MSALSVHAFESGFSRRLRPDQQAAAEALLAHDTGVLAATTAFGKTVVAAWLIAQRRCQHSDFGASPATHGTMGRAPVHVSGGLPAKSIGRLGGGRKKLTGTLDVALMQSLVRRETVDDRVWPIMAI
jgi:superfamily II DNA or RNA helicase